MGRPPLPEEEKGVSGSVRMKQASWDELDRYALGERLSSRGKAIEQLLSERKKGKAK